MKAKRNNDPDAIRLKQKKHIWKRFFKIFPKCNLPWLWVISYIIVEAVYVNVGVTETDFTAQLFSGDVSAAMLAKLIGVMVANLIISNAVVFLSQLTSARINRNMRIVLLNKVLRLPLNFFKDEDPQEAIYRVTNNAIVVDSTVMIVIIPIITALYKSFLIFGRVFTYDWRLSVILLVFVPLQIIMAIIFGRINYSLSERDSSVFAKLTEKLSEMIRNIPMAKAFAKENRETERGKALIDRLYRLNIKSGWFDQFRDFSDTFLTLLQALIITFAGIALLSNGDITRRSWIAFFMFSSTFNGAVQEILLYYNNLRIIQGGAERVCDIMDAKEENLDGEPCGALSGNIELKNVDFSYNEGQPVLSGANCFFPDKGVTVLMGESGCGKSTLVNLIMRLYDVDFGNIFVSGKSIDDYALEDYRRNFVMVPQNPMLFSGSVRENVCYGNENVSDSELTDALKKANAYDFVMALPNGLDEKIDEYGGSLSGGQRKKLALARALLSNTPYLIFDEPTSSLDALAASEFFGIMRGLSESKGIIVIAHTPAALSAADRVVVIENGKCSSYDDVSSAKAENAFVRSLIGKEAAV